MLIEQGSLYVPDTPHWSPGTLKNASPAIGVQRVKVAEAVQVASATITCLFKHMGHLEKYKKILPKFQQSETTTADFPSCEMEHAFFLLCSSQKKHGSGAGLQMISRVFFFFHLPGKKEGLWLPDQFSIPNKGWVRGVILKDVHFPP